MNPHIWPSEIIPGIGVSQIPLILAWALTIHKAQGATLDIAEVDVGSGIFECGQTYVALSRVKSLEGLYLTSFDAKRIRINRKVQEFYEMLELSKKVEETNLIKKEQEQGININNSILLKEEVYTD
jgi:ATP-dependent DNA helicase PIF1